jgi:hypothetical protein
MRLYINGKSERFPWKTVANSFFLPQMVYADLDKDGRSELVVILCQTVGVYSLQEEVHVVNSEDLSELTVMDPRTALASHVNAQLTSTEAKIYIDGKSVLDYRVTYINQHTGDKNPWFSTLKIGSMVSYYVSNDALYAPISAQVSPTGFVGNFVLTYGYKDGRLEVANVAFSPDF